MALLSSSGLTSAPTSAVQTSIGPAGAASATNVLDKGNALLNNPAPAYTGQLTAGTSGLQNEAWQGLSNLTLPSALTNAGQGLQDISAAQAGSTYSGPTTTAGTFDQNAAQQYMNPYLQQSLNPQLEEARRQAMITQQGNAAKATSQGAFGGTRAALMESEGQRNLGTNLANITGQGYNTAYNNAATQFNADQARNMTAQAANMQNAQYGASYGLQALQNAATSEQGAANAGAQQAQYGLANLTALGTAGNTQQAQNQAGLNALYNQYLDQRTQPWTNLANQANLVKGIGGSNADTYGAAQSGLQKAVGVASGAADLMKNMKAAGMDSAAIDKALKAVGYNPTTLTEEVNGNPGGISNIDKSAWTDNGDGTFTTSTGQLVDADGNPVN